MFKIAVIAILLISMQADLSHAQGLSYSQQQTTIQEQKRILELKNEEIKRNIAHATKKNDTSRIKRLEQVLIKNEKQIALLNKQLVDEFESEMEDIRNITGTKDIINKDLPKKVAPPASECNFRICPYGTRAVYPQVITNVYPPADVIVKCINDTGAVAYSITIHTNGAGIQ